MTEFSPGFCGELGRKCVDARADNKRLRAALGRLIQLEDEGGSATHIEDAWMAARRALEQKG